MILKLLKVDIPIYYKKDVTVFETLCTCQCSGLFFFRLKRRAAYVEQYEVYPKFNLMKGKMFVLIFTNLRTERRGNARFSNRRWLNLWKQLYLRHSLALRIHAVPLSSLLGIDNIRNKVIIKVIIECLKFRKTYVTIFRKKLFK